MYKDKIALVTGAAGGIGLAYVRELLQNEIKGVTILDVNKNGEAIAENLNKEFGPNKVLFLSTDVGDINQLKDAFEQSLQHWNGLDIVINNAGMCNEKKWQQTILVNCMGTAHGTLLAFDYMSTAKGGKGGVIVNTSSVSAIETCPLFSVYSGTKSFILSFSRGLGTDLYYKHNGVKVLTVCPGATKTCIMQDVLVATLDICPNVRQVEDELAEQHKFQSAQHVAKHVMNLIDTADNGTAWVIENAEPPYQIYEHKISSFRNENCK